MRSCATLSLYLVASLLGSSFATSEELRYDGTLIAGTRYIAPKYPESIQIFMRKRGEQYWYIFWQGPSGIAVLPCNDERFKIVGEKGPYYYGTPDPIIRPPFPPYGFINIPYRGTPRECFYASTGLDAGQFRCGSYMIMDCRKDPQYQVSDDSAFHCSGGEEYHRGFVCEY